MKRLENENANKYMKHEHNKRKAFQYTSTIDTFECMLSNPTF